MNYFSVSFLYPGPYVNCPDDDDETRSAWDHEARIEGILKAASIEFRHEYSWPDGSCYKYVRTGLDNLGITNAFQKIFNDTPYRANVVRELQSDHRVSSRDGYQSIAEAFGDASGVRS